MIQWFVVFCCMFALSGCEKASVHPPLSDSLQPRQHIAVAFTTQPQSTLVHTALGKGYFADQGLEVQPLIHSFGKAALQSLLDGKADFATVAETPLMFSVLRGDRIFVIANIESSSTNNAVLARKEAGIVNAVDLKGKRVGFTPGTTSDFFLDSFLTAQGLTRQEIRPVALKPDDMAEAMAQKTVDAISTWNYPLAIVRRQLGADAVVFFDQQIYTETFNIVAMQDYVQKNPEAVKRFLRALIQAEGFVTKHPQEAQDLLVEAIKVDKALVREVWSAFNYQVALDQTLLLTLEDETRWAMRSKQTDQVAMPAYVNFIHLDSLKAVKPEAIRMNR